MTKTIVLVLTMHRSRSSMLSKMLHVAFGYDGGKNLLTAGNHANPDGYYENLMVYRFNEKMLHLLGMSYESTTMPDDDQCAYLIDSHAKKLQILLEREFSSEYCFIKDPRILYLFDLYNHVILDLLGWKLVPLMLWRSPIQCAKSFHKAVHISVDKALDIARCIHTRMHEIADDDTIHVDSDKLVADPDRELANKLSTTPKVELASCINRDLIKKTNSRKSSYDTQDLTYGDLLTMLTFTLQPKLIVEFGVLDGYSNKCFSKSQHATIDSYDIFDEFNGNHAHRNSCLNTQYGNFYKSDHIRTKYKPLSIDILHVDIANDAKTVDALEPWLPLVRHIVILEGGSNERDNIWWMQFYSDKRPMNTSFDQYSGEWQRLTIGTLPSITVLRRRMHVHV